MQLPVCYMHTAISVLNVRFLVEQTFELFSLLASLSGSIMIFDGLSLLDGLLFLFIRTNKIVRCDLPRFTFLGPMLKLRFAQKRIKTLVQHITCAKSRFEQKRMPRADMIRICDMHS